MGNEFKIQIPQSIVRNNEVSDKEFVLLGKLIQIYKSQPGEDKNLTYTIKSYKKLMNYINITDQRTFRECLNGLYQKELITEDIIRLPRNGNLTISLSQKVIPDLNEGQMFTQLESAVLNMSVIEKVGHTGVRILYYLKSWINYSQYGKDHCYASVERMSDELGASEKTFIKYIQILEKVNFIKVKRFEPKQDDFLLERWNNHYFILHENIKKFIENNTSMAV